MLLITTAYFKRKFIVRCSSANFISLSNLINYLPTVFFVLNSPLILMALEEQGNYICFLIFIVPIPDVLLTTQPSDVDAFVEGTYVDLVCNVINKNIGIDINITVNWFRNTTTLLSNSTEYSINTVVDGINVISTLRIKSLNFPNDDEEIFWCETTVEPSSVLDFVIGTTVSHYIILNIQGA